MTDPIIKTIDVSCSPQEAFAVFVERIAVWWPLDGHASSAADGKAALAVTIEPKVGGRMYETRHDGTIDEWGKVLAFAPGERLTTTWHPGNNKHAPTQLDVTFEDLEGGRCRVTLTHSGWEAWGDKAQEMRDNYDTGWDFVFGDRYATAVPA